MGEAKIRIYTIPIGHGFDDVQARAVDEEVGEMSKGNFEELSQRVLGDRDARAAALENDARRQLASVLEEVRVKRGLSLRGFAREIGTSMSQVQRVLHRELGGSLTLKTIIRACDALSLRLKLHVEPVEHVTGKEER